MVIRVNHVRSGRDVLVRNVLASTTICELKERADGMADHTLVFAGRRMDNECTVGHYNLQQGTVVHMVTTPEQEAGHAGTGWRRQTRAMEARGELDHATASAVAVATVADIAPPAMAAAALDPNVAQLLEMGFPMEMGTQALERYGTLDDALDALLNAEVTVAGQHDIVEAVAEEQRCHSQARTAEQEAREAEQERRAAQEREREHLAHEEQEQPQALTPQQVKRRRQKAARRARGQAQGELAAIGGGGQALGAEAAGQAWSATEGLQLVQERQAEREAEQARRSEQADERRIELPGGSVYIGQLGEDGKPHGTGTLVWADGGRYKGEWAAGRRHGTGTYVFASGGWYEGEWSAGEQHGTGTLFHADGRRCEGEWAADGYNGRSTRADGTVLHDGQGLDHVPA